MSLKKKIITNHLGYPEIRNIKIPLKEVGLELTRVPDYYSIVHWVLYKFGLNNKRRQRFRNKFWTAGLIKYDFLHLFNGISYDKKPWIVTFETSLPRWGNNSRQVLNKGYRLLAKDNCKAIVAISDRAKMVFLDELNNNCLNQSIVGIITRKTHVIQPPQACLSKGLNSFDSQQKFKLLFVGRLFFLKGGAMVVDSIIELVEKYNLHIELVVISNMEYGDWITNSTKACSIYYEKLMNDCNYITHYKSLSNEKVLDLMSISDLGLLPTYFDTYGYSVLEFQAHGCPVVTTDICALPEVNNNEVGWVISVGKTEELKTALLEAYWNRDLLRKKGILARKRILDNHNPKLVGGDLLKLYTQ